MIRTPNGKNLMNLQEAVQWLLDNNALPFQCTANYVAGAEIGLGTIVNPTPAKVRVGSLIFFADSKVSTVIALTSNSFICSDEYNDLVDDVVYVSNVALNASGHLIVTLSNGTDIDAGLIKQVSGFSINASQHLIVSYNDGTTTDLGAIFTGNISISGTLSVSGAITGGSITENMSGYEALVSSEDATQKNTPIYISACKNGNKITFVSFIKFKRKSAIGSTVLTYFNIPAAVGAKLYPFELPGFTLADVIGKQNVPAVESFTSEITAKILICKASNTQIYFYVTNLIDFTIDTEYLIRIEATFLLNDPLLP